MNHVEPTTSISQTKYYYVEAFCEKDKPPTVRLGRSD